MNHDPTQLLAEILLRGAILLPACLLIALILRRGSASLIRRFWRCTLFALLLASALTLAPPLLTFTSNSALLPPANHAPVATSIPTETATVNGTPAASLESVLGLPEPSNTATSPRRSRQAETGPSSFQLTLPLALAALWLLGAALFAARKLIGAIGVRRLRRAATPVDHDDWQRDLASVRATCGVKRPVTLCHHLALRSPIVTGVRKPAIILPSDFADYSADDRRAVLLHELAHVRNRDAFFRWIASLIKILHWPNPFVWIAERSMRLAEERASDDAVLNGGINGPTYAELLAKLASGGAPLIGDPGTAGESAMAQPKTLLPRVHAILRPRQARRSPSRAASLTLATTTLILAVLAGGSAIVGADPKEKPATKAGTPVAAPQEPSLPTIDRKLDSIIIPRVSFEDATLEEALEFIRTQSQQLDEGSGARGINIINKLAQIQPAHGHGAIGGLDAEGGLSRAPSKRKLSLNLERIPLRALLEYICEVTATSYRSTEYAIVISPISYEGDDLISRNFRIPAKILEAELTRYAQILHDEGGAPQDPFADEPAVDEEGNPPPLTAFEWLRAHGVDFAPGASAFYTKGAGTLMVRNTPTQLDFISHIVDSLNGRPSRAGMTPDAAARLSEVKEALQNIVIPELDFQQATLPEALDYLRLQAKQLSADASGFSPVQFALLTDLTAPNSDPAAPSPDATAHSIKITLKLRQIPLGVAIKHIVDLAKMQSTVGAYGIEIRPRYSDYNNIHLATFLLTPENMERIASSITNRIDDKSHPSLTVIFKTVGVEFPPGAAIFWNSKSGHLIVRNTLTNLNLVETFLEGLEPPESE